jgi:hypothetical protein
LHHIHVGGAGEGLEKLPETGEHPSDEEGLKSNHSGYSSPATLDMLGDGKKEGAWVLRVEG